MIENAGPPSPDARSTGLRSAVAMIAYAGFIVVVSALSTPWIFRLAHPHMAGVPFRRVFDRVLLVAALAGLWPLLRTLGIRSWGELGYTRTANWWPQILTGLAVGIGSFAAVGGLLVLLGLRTFVSPAGGVMQVAGFGLTGIGVALIEETLFRGGLQGAMHRSASLLTAVVLTSVIYSAVHFLKPKGAGIAAGEVNWLSGFVYLGQVFARSSQAPGVAVGFVTLWLAGCILGLAFARTRALYLSMGIHAGWVFTLKTYAWLTDAIAKRTWWGGATLVDNALMWPVLVIVLWLCWKKLKPRQP